MPLTESQFPPRPTMLAQELLKPQIKAGDCVVDATAGNGHDTLFLAECVGENGRVLAFDVQEAALDAASERVGEMSWVEYFLQSHREMSQHVAPGSVAVVMFNLGYLPGEDHALTTEAGETVEALAAAADLLKPGGLISVICYPGHPAGAIEAEAVEAWMLTMTPLGWRVVKYATLGTKRAAPFLLIAAKGAGGV